MNEQEILEQIQKNDFELQESRSTVSVLKEKLMAAETRLIAAKLKDSELKEKLRKFRNAHYAPELEEQEAIDARFKSLLPELLEKVK
jgi:hypothetical protein